VVHLSAEAGDVLSISLLAYFAKAYAFATAYWSIDASAAEHSWVTAISYATSVYLNTFGGKSRFATLEVRFLEVDAARRLGCTARLSFSG